MGARGGRVGKRSRPGLPLTARSPTHPVLHSVGWACRGAPRLQLGVERVVHPRTGAYQRGSPARGLLAGLGPHLAPLTSPMPCPPPPPNLHTRPRSRCGSQAWGLPAPPGEEGEAGWVGGGAERSGRVGGRAPPPVYPLTAPPPHPHPTHPRAHSHFTAIVWASTRAVGCGAALCPGSKARGGACVCVGGGARTARGPPPDPTHPNPHRAHAQVFVVCEYWPPGNVAGQFGKNVRQLAAGKPNGGR